MTLLAEDPELWDTVFSESPERVGLVLRLLRAHGKSVLDVGCATGSLCRELRRAGAETFGVDINRRFIDKARTKDPAGHYMRGNMRNFRLRHKFDVLVCLGTTFSYNLTNRDIQTCLRNFRGHLRQRGCLMIDVLNAAAFTGPRHFELRSRHEFRYAGARAVATITHRLHLQRQTMSEQVSWAVSRRPRRRDPPEHLRMLFPQELRFHLQVAGFERIRLMDSYTSTSRSFAGRRLIAVAFRSGH